MSKTVEILTPCQRGEQLRQLLALSPSIVGNDEPKAKEYLKSLRRNRKAVLEEWVRIHGDNPMPSKVVNSLVRIQNSTRGHLGELLGRVYLTQAYQVLDADLVTDRKVFKTPFGERRIDVWWADHCIAVECKMGYVTASADVRRQIDKDRALLETGKVSKCIWLLIKDGSEPLRSRLAETGLSFHVGWPLPPSPGSHQQP